MRQSEPGSAEITKMLREWGDGKQGVLDSLLPLVYTELHRQAARYLRKERPGHTLQTTALINEAYLKLVGRKVVVCESRTDFFGIAAQAMRRILVDHAKAKHREKRGGDVVTLSLDDGPLIATKGDFLNLVELDEALKKLAKFDYQQARVVELRYFGGLSLEETAAVLGVSRATVGRDWESSRAWLYRELTK